MKSGSRQERDELSESLSRVLAKFEVTPTDQQLDVDNYIACMELATLLTKKDPWRNHLSRYDVFELIARRIARFLARDCVTSTGPLLTLIRAATAEDLKTDMSRIFVPCRATTSSGANCPRCPSGAPESAR
jgi:hypothetical protein